VTTSVPCPPQVHREQVLDDIAPWQRGPTVRVRDSALNQAVDLGKSTGSCRLIVQLDHVYTACAPVYVPLWEWTLVGVGLWSGAGRERVSNTVCRASPVVCQGSCRVGLYARLGLQHADRAWVRAGAWGSLHRSPSSHSCHMPCTEQYLSKYSPNSILRPWHRRSFHSRVP
jgi:hypothetical protein